jgi:hypothetical protein
MSRTLLIVDMQTKGFSTADDDNLVENVCKEVKRAKKRRAGIVVCEYMGYGKTDHRIMNAIGSYHRFNMCYKRGDDGSRSVAHIAQKSDFDVSNWRVCGVNIAYCINATVEGLRKRIPKTHIEVKKDACSCVLSDRASWNKFDKVNGTVKRV